MKRIGLSALALALMAGTATAAPAYDVLIKNGVIYDGSGGMPYKGEVAIMRDHIVFVGPKAQGVGGRLTIDARGQAVAPGFIKCWPIQRTASGSMVAHCRT